MIKSGIYAILNILNGKYYIGSAIDIRQRWWQHKTRLRKGNSNCVVLQSAWNKYGENVFIFTVLEYVFDYSKLVEREQFWFDELKPFTKEFGYNASPTASSQLGIKRSDETRKKLSIWQLGKPKSPAHVQAIRNRKLSEESKLKLIENGKKTKGRKHTNSAKAKVVAALIGRKVSEETRAKISASLVGKKRTSEQRANMSDGRWKAKGIILESGKQVELV